MSKKPRITTEQFLYALDLLILEELDELEAQEQGHDTEGFQPLHPHWQTPGWQTPSYQVQVEA